MAEEYSHKLAQYLGQVELKASQERDDFKRHMIFCDAPQSLSKLGLSEEELRLAREVLSRRARDTKPWNIGAASGEAGEAD